MTRQRGTEVMESEQIVSDGHARSGADVVLRPLGLIAAAVPTVVGLVAVAKVDWSAHGFDALPVKVGSMVFSPTTAVALTVIGLICILAAAVASRNAKLVVGAVLLCGGIAIVAAQPVIDGVTTDSNIGWMIGIVGAVLAVVGLLMPAMWSTHGVPRDPVAA
jgi:hypothetical protein